MKQILVLLFATINLLSFAQQIPQYSQWMLHQFAMNPAHAGIKRCVDVHTVYRAQWVGLEGAPNSGFVTASVPLSSKRKKFLSARHGMGVKFERDRVGQMSSNRFNLAYAAHFNFTAENRLSLGVYAGMVQFGFNHATAITVKPDPSVMKEMTILRPDAHFGAWWNSTNYYIGVMANQLIVSKWEIGYQSRFRFHFAINGGYRFMLKENLGLITSAMIRMPFNGPINADLNVQLDIKNMFNIGVGFRTKDALIVMAGFKINQQFALHYAFDMTVSGMNRISNNTHEIGISFLTCKPVSTATSKCPLFE